CPNPPDGAEHFPRTTPDASGNCGRAVRNLRVVSRAHARVVAGLWSRRRERWMDQEETALGQQSDLSAVPIEASRRQNRSGHELQPSAWRLREHRMLISPQRIPATRARPTKDAPSQGRLHLPDPIPAMREYLSKVRACRARRAA